MDTEEEAEGVTEAVVEEHIAPEVQAEADLEVEAHIEAAAEDGTTIILKTGSQEAKTSAISVAFRAIGKKTVAHTNVLNKLVERSFRKRDHNDH